MKKILFIFPHPDDESFGPAGLIWQLQEQGHQVDLLTLTAGEATKERFKFGYSKQEMGAIRIKELENAATLLGIHNLTILDFPDSGLKELCPQELEEAIENHIHQLQPDILITYPVHGISGFFDHLVCHAVVKSVFCRMKKSGSPYPKRLAFFALPIGKAAQNQGRHHLCGSPEEDIDCIVSYSSDQVLKMDQALDCYLTYQEVINDSIRKVGLPTTACLEFFGEQFSPPIDNLTKNLNH